ncbi:MAG: putative lipoprotein [Hydrocarboniphaga sp.]|uniref:hypothetical protein n=1 Tax=Hydrocarboniphaga sp. TaxID=2033016 RepID=UPI00260659FD|nr:hypothetical protein [Hydrocarboniphaga sp.]MDB5969712.1 putative lipoprotein [Hydrocarboniphaga sp.]
MKLVQRAGSFRLALLVPVVVMLIQGCASVPGQPTTQPRATLAETGSNARFEITQDQKVSVSTFYSRVIAHGTRWECRGAIPAGDVYRPINTVFTVESSNVHEAYLVLKGQDLVGYYLPVEQTFAAVDKPIPLVFTVVSSQQ